MVFAAVAMRDGLNGPLAGPVGGGAGTASWAVLAGMFVPLLTVALLVEAWMRLALRSLGRTGNLDILSGADTVLTGSRGAIAVIHVVGVLGLGWLDLVRMAVGDLVLVDEVIVVLPALLTGVAGWWSHAPIAQAARNAVLLGAMERGEPVYPPQSRAGYVWLQVRLGLGLIAVPMLIIIGWTDLMLVGERWLSGDAEQGPGGGAWDGLWSMAPLVGAAAAFVLTPALMRWVWPTSALGDGPTRDALVDVCRREGVRVRDILVWRTHGSIVNAVVLGVVPRLRYVIFSDAILDRMSTPGLVGVMAHEVAHVRRRHIPWLLGVMAAAFLAGSACVQGAAWALGLDRLAGSWAIAGRALQIGGALGVLGAALAAFGWVSRRFEWQADAFAVQHLTRFPAGEAPAPGDGSASGATVITPEAAGAAAAMLQSVARLNFIDPTAWMFRHGSIADRRRRVLALVGRPVADLPIDRTVRRIKLATIGILALAAAAGVAGGGGGVW